MRKKKVKKARKKKPELMKQLERSLLAQLSHGGCWSQGHVEKIAWVMAANGDLPTIEANGEGTHDLRFGPDTLLLQEFMPAAGST